MISPTPPRIPRTVPTWHTRAACRAFPELDWVEARTGTSQAVVCRMICAACPVRYECAVDALHRGEPWGIWGGLDRRDRREIARTYGYPRPAVLPEHGTNARYVKHGCTCADCRRAHAVYEAERRARARAKAKARGVWRSSLLVLARPVRIGRTRLGAGQYVLPLPDVPAPRHAEPAPLPAAA